MQSVEHRVDNGAGWELSLFQTWDPDRLRSGSSPVLVVPGYGMNSFIFSFHPRGPSLEGFLANAGHEVWRVDLRAQGGSRCTGGSDSFGLEDLALTDLGVAIDAVVRHTKTGASRVDVLGASLGGTILAAHMALRPDHRVGSIVAIGAPVRWVRIHPLLKLAFASPTLVGLIRIRGTRRIAEQALPHLLRHTPWVLSLYMNPSIVDIGAAAQLCRTVEDPNRHVNRQIAQWIREKDLVLRGVNVSDALARVTRPLLCVVANGDGVVPRETAEFVYRQVASRTKTLLEVGTSARKLAHADMFVSNEAHDRVFRPVAEWLAEHRRDP